jgi:hypothetical protein
MPLSEPEMALEPAPRSLKVVMFATARNVNNALYVARLGGSRGRAKLRRPLDVGLPPTETVDKEQ